MGSGRDEKQGRWSWVRLQGNKRGGQERNIRIINAYRVCQKDVTESSFTSYMQQYEIQQKEGIATPFPHKQVMLDLGTFITKCKEEGDEIILCLDANEETETHNENAKEGTITHLMHKSTLVCAHEFLGYKSGTFESSGRQLDYVLVTPGILPAILRGGYRPYSEGLTSDHKSLFIDFEAGILFGDDTGDIDISRTRNLNTKYPTRT